MAPIGAILRRNFPVFQVFGANTNVGKTVFSTILCRVAKRLQDKGTIWYLKPVSTGSLSEADNGHISRHAQGTITQNLYQFDMPVSPHLAALASRSRVPSDAEISRKISVQIKENSKKGSGFMLVESAGGINSPGPSGSLQTDIYRPLRLPTIYVADWQLGGISTSISAFESLTLHGYSVEGVAVLKDTYYRNFEYFQAYFQERGIPVLVVEQPPEKTAGDDEARMNSYYDSAESDSKIAKPSKFVQRLIDCHENRISKLESMSTEGFETIWYPFTQHQNLQPQSITTIDSAYGDYFQTVSKSDHTESSHENLDSTTKNLLQPALDGSASWWTQGLGHGSYDLTLAAAHAAARYGHVMFASAINEPALSLAKNLLKTVNNPKLKRVFYSDNGSTAMEVGLKMALTATCARYGWNISQKNIEIIGLQGSYHGDTMGAMDMSEPSVFNERIHWYRGRGYWFDPPFVQMQEGKWIVRKPASLGDQLGPATEHPTLQDVFSPNRDLTSEAAAYESHIRSVLQQLCQVEKRYFGALVMEPVVLGAGGMVLVDPLFQRTLAKVVREAASMLSPSWTSMELPECSTEWSGLPIVADEVFTGLYRLGHRSSSSLLNLMPDISAHAKLLTGGLLPLACTLASENIFKAFLAEGKADALLHGHSYTAHPVGCAVADRSLKLLSRMDEQGAWEPFKADWLPGLRAETGKRRKEVTSPFQNNSANLNAQAETQLELWSVWSSEFVSELSHIADKVEGVWALGSVLAISLRDQDGAGYTSNASQAVQKRLMADDGLGWSIHCRVLGNVIYLMSSQTSRMEDVRLWESRVVDALRQQD